MPRNAHRAQHGPARVLKLRLAVSRQGLGVLAEAQGRPGHVFNLGHGVMPAMDPDVLTEIVKVVHEEGTVRS